MEADTISQLKITLKYFHNEFSCVVSSLWKAERTEERKHHVKCLVSEGNPNLESHHKFVENPDAYPNLKVQDIDNVVDVKSLSKLDPLGCKTLIFVPFCKVDGSPKFLIMLQSKLERFKTDQVASHIAKVTPSFDALFGYIAKAEELKEKELKVLIESRESELVLTKASDNIRQLKNILDAMEAIIWVVDADGNHIYVNQRWKKTFQRPYKRGIQDFYEVFEAEDLEDVKKFFNLVMHDSKENNQMECRLSKEKDQAWFRIKVSPLEKDSRSTWLVIAEEISGTKRSIHSSLNLPGSSFSNTVIKYLIEEMQEPTNAIQAVSSIAKNDPDIILVLQRLGKRLHDLIEDASLCVNVDEPRDKVNMIQLIREIATPVGRMANSKGLNFTVFLSNTFPKYFFVDRIRFSKAIGSIIENAVQYTNKGYVLVVCTSIEVEKKFRYKIKINIVDTGDALDENERKELFNFNAKTSRGTAGLYSGKALIEKMGGSIEVTKNAESGSTLCVTMTLDCPLFNSKQSMSMIEELHENAVIKPHHTGSFVFTKLSKFISTVECIIRQALPNLDLNTYSIEEVPDSEHEKLFVSVEIGDDLDKFLNLKFKHVIFFVFNDNQRLELNDLIQKRGLNAKVSYLLKPISVESLSKIDDDNRNEKLELNPSRDRSIGQGKRFLLLEQDPLLSQAIQVFIEDFGAQVHAFSEEDAAVEFAKKSRIDIALLNVSKGLGIAKLLRETNNPFLIAMSSQKEVDLSEYILAGFNKVVRKPVNFDEIANFLLEPLSDQ